MMKKIFLLVAFFVLGKMWSYAQYPITQTLGSDSTIVISKGALQSRLINVTYTDTTAANLQRIRQYPGAQIATTTGGLNLWIRNATATAWIPVATGSGNNIYTIDGTLLGNRTLTGAGYSLTFNQLSKLLFNADSTTINTDQATISNNGVSTLSVKGATGRMFLVDTTAPADERIYELKSSNGEFYISILNDAQTSNDSAFLITSASRVGINTLNPDSTLKVGGGVNILGGLRVGNLPTSPGTKQLRINAQGQFSVTDTLIDAGGTVTSVATNDGTGITGGTITTSGTLAIDTTIISTRAWRQKGVDSLQANINLKLNIVDTTGMLANYVNSVGYGLGKTSQTVYVDSASLSNYYLRRKDSLTATNPLGYVTQKILADTAAAIRASDAGGSVTSVGLTMPAAFNVGNSPITTAGTISVTAAGLVSQYIRGDGTLADFPGGGGGGGASISYYLNGSVNQGTFGGNTYYEMNKTPIFGTGTDFSINADGYIAQFITDAGDPGLLKIPGGNWNFELFFNASSGGGTPTYYVELYKYDGTTFTLIASGSSNPDVITGGTSVEAYFSTLPVPETVLLATDRLAVRIYVTHAGRTITLHTEDNNLCQVITTFTTGITALNGLTEQVQYFTTGTSGTDFNISSSVATHTFNLPTASATNRGALSTTDWTTFNNKVGGSLISGYITKATGTNTIDTSQLFQSNGLIGIGTTSPTQKLQVSGNAYVNGQLFAGDTALSTYQVEGILSTPYVLGRKAVDNTLSTEARPTGIQGHVVGRGSIANRLQGGTFYATTDSASTANSTGSLRASNSWSAHNGSGTLANAWGSYNIVQNKTTGTITNAYGSVSGVENRGATSTINKLHGTTTEIWNNFGGTVDTAFGQVISIYNNNAASNIGAVYGLSIGKGLVTPTGGTHYWKNSGTIGTSYGLYLDTSIDVGTTKYSIFSNSNSNSYFKGKLGVGTTSPDSAFQVATGALFQRGVRMSALPQAPGTKALRIDASGTISYADTLIDAGGTVTSVATNNGTGITGGTITTTGTLAIDTLLISTRAWRQKGIDSVAALINSNVSGTTNYVAKFTGSNTIGNSQIIDNGTAVGIGTAASNAYKLSVAGIYRGVGVGNAARIELYDTQSGGATFYISPQESLGVTSLGTYGAFPILFVTNSAERIRISSAGDVTISTIANATTDTDKFLVSDSGVIKYRTGAEVLSDIGGQGTISLAAIGSSPNANGATLSSNTLTLQPASASFGGVLTTGFQEIAGWKRFTGNPIQFDNHLEIKNLNSWGVSWGYTSFASKDTPVFGFLRGHNATGSVTYNAWFTYGTTGDRNYTLPSSDGTLALTSQVPTVSGTTNYIPKFTSSSAIGNSAIYDNSGNIGIGTTGAVVNFQVNGASEVYSALSVAGTRYMQFGADATANYINSYNSVPLIFSTSATTSFSEKMRLDASGNLGIGTSSPAYKLDVSTSAAEVLRLRGTNGGGSNNTQLRFYGSASATDLWAIGTEVSTGTTGRAFDFYDLVAGANRMRLDASGNLGLGTSSPSAKLDVLGNVRVGGSGNPSLTISGTDGAYTGLFYINAAGGGSSKIYANGGSNTLILGTNSTDRVTLDASGNLGLGVTPSAWFAVHRPIQIGGAFSGTTYSAALSAQTNDNVVTLFNNAFVNTSAVETYYASAEAAKYRINRNSHEWYTAPSGTAGNAISFTQAMTLDASGRLGIGTTSPARKVETVGGNEGGFNVIGNNGATNLTSNGLGFNTGYGVSYITSKNTAGANADLYIEASKFLFSGGNVGIGTTSPVTISGYTALTLNNATTGGILTFQQNGTNKGSIYNDASNIYLGVNSGAAIFETSGAERMRITSGGEVLINTTSDAGDYKLQVNGDIFLTNGSTYTQMQFKDGTASGSTWSLISGFPNLGDFTIREAGVQNSFILKKTTGNLELLGSIKTAAPSGGTAQPWKLGSKVAATVTLDTANYIEVEVNGVAYKLAIVN